MVTIHWSGQAKDDLKDIFDYIASSSLRYANTTVNKIKERTQILKQNPFTGKMVQRYQDPNIRELVKDNYLIFYIIIDKENIAIAAIIHTKRGIRF